MTVKINEIDSFNINSKKLEEYEQLNKLFCSQKIARRDFLKKMSLFSVSCLMINNGIIQNVAHAFLPGLIIRFIAGQFFRRSVSRSLVGGFVRKVATDAASDLVIDTIKNSYQARNEIPASVSTVDYGTRYMNKTNNSNQLESVTESINLAELFGDAVWRKNGTDNPAAIMVTNYNDKTVEIPKLNMFLKDIQSRNNDFSTQMGNLGTIPAGTESLINLSVRDLPYTGLKKLEGDNGIYGSGRILVANNDVEKYINSPNDEHGMTVDELYKIYLEKNR
jgi:hypothetical protein